MATQYAESASHELPPKTTQRASLAAFVAVAVFAATVLPLLLFLKRFPRVAPLAVNAVDSFYYLTVARNSLHTPFYSFDGMYPTNGFHPVWQFLLYTAMRWNVLKPLDPFFTLHRLYIGNVLLLGVGFALLATFCAQNLNRQLLAFAAVCPGFLWFGVALSAPAYLANWSYLNGMETAVELVCLGLALLSFSTDRSSKIRLPISMFFFGLTVLCRLDDVFFLLPVIALVWISRSQRPVYQTVLSIMVPLTMISAYLLYNRMSVGIFMPTSGAVKSGLSIRSNSYFIEEIILPVRWFTYGGMNWFPEVFMRVYQILVPLFLCAAYILQRRKFRLGLVEALCIGVVLKSFYNFTNVRLFHQGSWYYAASVFAANLVIVLWLDRIALRLRPLGAKSAGLPGWASIAAGTILVSVSFNIYVNHLLAIGGAQGAENILDRRADLRAMVQRAGSDRFVEMDDGELAFATAMPTLSGQGLVLDPEASRALLHGHFFDLALHRKYSLLMASGLYRDIINQKLDSEKSGAKSGLFLFSVKEFDRYDLLPVAVDSASDVELYRISPILHQ